MVLDEVLWSLITLHGRREKKKNGTLDIKNRKEIVVMGVTIISIYICPPNLPLIYLLMPKNIYIFFLIIAMH